MMKIMLRRKVDQSRKLQYYHTVLNLESDWKDLGEDLALW